MHKSYWGLHLIAVLTVTFLSACEQGLMATYAASEEALFAKDHLALYQSRDFEQMLSELDPSIIGDDITGEMEQLAAYFPSGSPVSVEMVGYNWNSGTQGWSGNVSYQYEFADTFLLASVSLTRINDELFVNGLNLQTMEMSLQEANAFTVGRRGAVGYLFLTLAVTIPLFVVVSFITCIRTPIPRRKWFWATFTLLGFGVFSMNWTTGDVGFSMLSWQLLGAGFYGTGQYGPVILSIAAPFGAILFWIKRREWLLTPSTAEDGDPESPTTNDDSSPS